MLSVVWWTCALIALATAHIYERCELARELLTLGISRDHLSTWVCIAYHESRFDTGAQNRNSGDHGLLQISQLFWCGAGKACGVSCASLRDEDISNDVKCALRIHEEHTRIQGDGFMAWVVYPLYCKQNSKKFLAGCEESLKNTSVKATEKLQTDTHTKLFQQTDSPSYLSINSVLRGQYENEVNSDKVEQNWLEYKFDNVDDLILPNKVITKPMSESDNTVSSIKNDVLGDISKQNKGKKPPAYLTIPLLIQMQFEDLGAIHAGETERTDWGDIIFDNIDELKLPVPSGTKSTIKKLSPSNSNVNRIKIKDKGVLPTSTQNLPDYLKISKIIEDYLGSDKEDKKHNKGQQVQDFQIENIDKWKLPEELFNKVTLLNPSSSTKETFKATDISENKFKISQTTPTFTTYDSNFKVNQKLPTYLKIVSQLYGNKYHEDNILKSNTASKQPVRKTEIFKHRHRGRNFTHISTTPEVPANNQPPVPRRVESNQFRHRSTTQPSIQNKPESIISTVTLNKSTTSDPTPSTKAMLNFNPSTKSIHQYSVSIPRLPSLKPQIIFTSPETGRKTEVSGQSTTQKYAVSVLDSSNILNSPISPKPWSSTLVSTTQKITTIPASKTSLFDLYLNSQKKIISSTPKYSSWSIFRPSFHHELASNAASPQVTELALTTIKPSSTLISTSQIKESMYQSTTKSTKPVEYTYSTLGPWKIKTLNSPLPTQNFSTSQNSTWSIQKLEVSTPRTTLFPHKSYTLKPWSWSFTQQTNAMISVTPKANNYSIGGNSSSESTLQKIETTTQGTPHDIKSWVSTNYSTTRPWSLSDLGHTSSTQSKIKLEPTTDRTYTTSKPWSWTWLSSQETKSTTQKTMYKPWTARNFSTLNPWQKTITPLTPRNLERTTSLKPWDWPNTHPVSLKTETDSPLKSWSTSTELQTPVTTQRTVTSRSGFTWGLSKSRSWATTPPKSESHYKTTQSSTKPWDSSYLSTYKPFPRITTTPTPKASASNIFFNYSSVSLTQTPATQTTSKPFEAWKTTTKNLTVSYSPTQSTTTPRTTAAMTTTQSLFDFYLNNFGRRPTKNKEEQRSIFVSKINSREI